MHRYFILFFLGLHSMGGLAQIPQVPEILFIGDQKLLISPRARDEIQKDVNALHANRKYFEIKANRAATYLPIVEEVLRMEGIPEEFKFLAIQESGYEAEAVSSSNAVGFWQFKAETAKEFGLTISSVVDERKHIVYSTKGAARYLKKSYFFLQNWVLVCQSYQMGLGGTQRGSDKRLFGADEMKIEKDTYWYVMKFLAHIVAFRPYLSKKPQNITNIGLYKAMPHEEIDNVLVNNNLEVDQFKELNRWLLSGNRNPFYKPYLMVVPEKEKVFARKEPKETVTIKTDFIEPKEFTKIKKDLPYDPSTRIIFIVNGKKAILAEEGDSKITLAIRGGISKDELVEFNDLRRKDFIQANKAYYLEKKSKKSPVAYHIYRKGESLWEISQTYAIRMDAILKKNHLEKGQAPELGQVLWLKKKRPAGTPPMIMETKEEEIASDPIPGEPEVITADSSLFERDSTAHLETDTLMEISSPNGGEKIDIEEKKSEVVHKVEQGQTLYSISKIYGCTVEDIMELNQIKTANLSIGQELRIPIIDP